MVYFYSMYNILKLKIILKLEKVNEYTSEIHLYEDVNTCTNMSDG